MKKFSWALFGVVSLLAVSPFAHGVLQVVAAENIYGNIAAVLGGDDVHVDSVLNNPNQDPHLFTSKPSTSKMVADADMLILNGANYDAWFSHLVKIKARSKAVTVLDVGVLVGVKPGANPHLWYRLSYINQLASALTKAYQQRLPNKRVEFDHRLQVFLQQQQQLAMQVIELKKQLHGLPVTATEPVAAYLAADLGLVVLDQAFQLAIMNDTEPSAQSRVEFEQHLQQHQVRALIYNSQVQDPVTEFMQQLSIKLAIPVIGVTELLSSGQSYQHWYQLTLDRFRQALSQPIKSR